MSADTTEFDPHDAVLLSLFTKVAAHGHATIGVCPADGETVLGGGYAYSVGLASEGLPELVVVGTPPEYAGHLINDVAAELRTRPSDRVLDIDPAAVLDTLPGEVPVRLRRIVPTEPGGYDFGPGALLSMADVYRRAYELGDAVTAVQVLYPTPEGAWPDDDGYEWGHLQPLLPTVDGSEAGS